MGPASSRCVVVAAASGEGRRRSALTWCGFLAAHPSTIVASDFISFTVVRRLYVLFSRAFHQSIEQDVDRPARTRQSFSIGKMLKSGRTLERRVWASPRAATSLPPTINSAAGLVPA